MKTPDEPLVLNYFMRSALFYILIERLFTFGSVESLKSEEVLISLKCCLL
jgi:hypothetical protein